MHPKVMAALVLLCVILLALAAWLLLSEDGADPREPIIPEQTSYDDSVEVQGSMEGLTGEQDETAMAGTAEEDVERTGLIPRATVFSGSVVDEETLEPVQRFTMSLTEIGMRLSSGVKPRFLEKSFNHEKGAFSITLQRAGQFTVWIEAPGYIMMRPLKVKIAAEKGLTDLAIKLKRGDVLAGRVVEYETGIPLVGAGVDARGVSNVYRDREGNLSRTFYGMDSAVKTDDNGRFRIIGLMKGDYYLTATHENHASQSVDVSSGNEQIELRLRKGYRIHGTAYDDTGNPASGIEIKYHLNEEITAGPFLSGPNGKYRTHPVLPGRFLITAEASGESESVEFTEETKLVEIIDRDVELDFGPHAGHVTWRGTFFAWEGKPGAQCKLRAWLDLDRAELSISRTIACDGEGRFEFRKLVPGTFKIAAFLLGIYRLDESSEMAEITFERPGVYDMDLSLHKTEISGMVIDAETGIRTVKQAYSVEARSLDDARQYTFGLEEDMKFYFRGLPPGRYRLSVYGLDFPPSNFEVSLADGQVIDDLQIAVPVSGELAVKISNVKEDRELFFRVYIRKKDGTASWEIGPVKKRGDGTWAVQFQLEVGSWALAVEENNLGRAERDFDVFRDKTTDVMLDASEFE